MRDHAYFVYMLTGGHHGTLYIGVTNDLLRRAAEHRRGVVPGFTRRHGISRLVWYEQFGDIREAIAREKTLKRWRRNWKIALLETKNPRWTDLYPVLAGNGSRVSDAPLCAASRPG